jgi:hypothetical protein
VRAATPGAGNATPPGCPGTHCGEPSRAELARAVPSGSRRIRGQREALRAGLSCPELAGVRADFRDHLTAWWRIHALHASWGGENRGPAGTTRPTRARVCELGGFGISTYKACRRWWEARGYVAIVRRGRTPLLRPGALADLDGGNEAQVYVLCAPRKRSSTRRGPAPRLSRPLSRSRRDVERSPAREAGPEQDHRPAADRPAAAQHGPLRGLSDGWWAHLTSPFTAAAWSTSDIIWAIDHEPDGRQHRHRLANVRHPAGWLRWRLARWLTPDGAPRPSRTALRAAAAAEARADAAAWRQARAEMEAGRSRDQAGNAARARAMLFARPRPGPVGPPPEVAP